MQKIFSFFLASGRKRRCRSVSMALWLLRLLRDAESDEMWHNSDLLDSIDADVSRRQYATIEDDYLNSEFALGHLESAIEDLEFAY
jgi:hypothetical protein